MTSVDKSKNVYLIPEKVTHGPVLFLLQLCNSRPQRYENFQFCSFICKTAPHNALTPHISETHLPIVSLNVRELKLKRFKIFGMLFSLNKIFARVT